MHASDVLGDPVRCRIVAELSEEACSAGELAEVLEGEFGISQPAASRHLRVLKEGGESSRAQWMLSAVCTR